jgi:hydroxymethylbilane synthase
MSRNASIRIGTRGSLLARTQSEGVAAALRQAGVAVELVVIATTGDVRTDIPIAGLVRAGGSDGVFVRELEQALRDGRIDAAVHSCKDLPTSLPNGLELACVPGRAEPFDVVVGRSAGTLASLPPHAVVGTSSVRRVMQVRALRPDVEVRPVRGNVDTRLRKLDAGEVDCLILAGAGLGRLGLGHRVTEVLQPPAFWPAIAQGALAIEVRADDERTRTVVRLLDCPETHAAVRAERSCLASLAGGCLAPIGGWARSEGGGLRLGAVVFGMTDGSVSRVTAEAVSESEGESPEHLGRRVAAILEAAGAADMLAAFRAQNAPS